MTLAGPVLVVCQDDDREADWLADAARRAGTREAHVITASQLVHRTRWSHRVDDRGTATCLTLADGSTIASESVGAVVNRLFWVTADGYRSASREDREYAGAEWFALVLSWLHAYGGRVLNRPCAGGLNGALRPPMWWRLAAAAVGLTCTPYSSRDDPSRLAAVPIARSVSVVGDTALGADGLPPATCEALVRLGISTDLDIFDAFLADDEDGWALVSVSPVAQLARFGSAGAEAVAAALDRAAQRG